VAFAQKSLGGHNEKKLLRKLVSSGQPRAKLYIIGAPQGGKPGLKRNSTRKRWFQVNDGVPEAGPGGISGDRGGYT